MMLSSHRGTSGCARLPARHSPCLRPLRVSLRTRTHVKASLGQPPLPKFKGEVYTPTLNDLVSYEARRYQYALTSHGADGQMKPGAIIYPKDDEDILAAIKYAKANKLAIAVRTGGHQYSGASSTYGRNILLDISKTYKGFTYDKDAGIVTTGVSRMIISLNKKLQDLNVFVPHGQCAHVHVGGHSHTGGYGLPGRAFGLFGDHITAIRIITADGKDPRWISRDTTDPEEAELFYAQLGGSPGNFGILTDIKLKVHRKEDHPKARGLKIAVPYNKEAVRKLLEVKAEMARDVDLPADFDFCLTVISQGQQWQQTLPDDDAPAPAAARAATGAGGAAEAEKHEKEALSPLAKFGFPADMVAEFHKLVEGAVAAAKAAKASGGSNLPTAVIVIFAEWANLEGPDQPYDPSFFDSIIAAVAGLPAAVQDFEGLGMPYLTGEWVFQIQREFLMPYNKRTYVTNSTTLHESGWVDLTTEQIHKYVEQWDEGCRIAVQIQHYGGSKSRYRTNDPEDKTSYSWRRDATVVATMDAFYSMLNLIGTPPKTIAKEWQKENDAGFKGPAGTFSPNMDRRVLWGSYYESDKLEERDLMKSWPLYHESQGKWDKLLAIKKRVDPDNIFSPNDFAIKA